MNGALDFSIKTVEAALEEAAAAMQGMDPHQPTFWQRHREVMSKCGSDLVVALGAKIDVRFDRTLVKIAGVTSTSTTGLTGALKNWLVAARKRVAS